jgi:valyl-tRNA synthetase
LLRLFAPALPFATEEVWSWWQEGSVHNASWPTADELRTVAGTDVDPAVLTVAAEALTAIRKAKSDAKASMRTGVTSATITDTADRLALLASAESDVRDAGKVVDWATEAGEGFALAVTLAES